MMRKTRGASVAAIGLGIALGAYWGNIAWGRVSYKILAPVNDPNKRGSTTDVLGSYFNVMTLLPERDKGSINVNSGFWACGNCAIT